MKKITLLAFILASFLTNAQIVLSEDFELGIPLTWTNQNNSIDPSALATSIWTIDGDGQTTVGWVSEETSLYTISSALGNYAYFDSDGYSGGDEDTSLTSPAIDCSSLSEVKLSFSHLFHQGYEGNGYVEISTDNINWSAVGSYLTPLGVNSGVLYGDEIFDISNIAAGAPEVYIRFRFTGDYSWSWAVDTIVVQQPLGSAPLAVTDMIPADGATDVEIMSDGALQPSKMIEFSWTESLFGDPATSFDISIGTDPSFNIGTLPGVVSGGGILYGGDTNGGWMPNTTYYWKITANNVAGSTDSPTQVFTTGANDPLGLEAVEATTFKAFPNPVIDIMNIEGNTPIDSVEIVNQLGQSVLEVDINSMFNNQINLSKLNTGIYFVRVKSASKIQTLQILKQ